MWHNLNLFKIVSTERSKADDMFAVNPPLPPEEIPATSAEPSGFGTFEPPPKPADEEEEKEEEEEEEEGTEFISRKELSRNRLSSKGK